MTGRKLRPVDQTQIFAAGEADAWYRRNRQTRVDDTSPDLELIAGVLESYRAEIANVLEIGCSDGRKLETLATHFDASGHGVDPSFEAVADGQARLRSAGVERVNLSVGTSDRLDFETGHFDLVHFGFSLYVIARERLFASLAEADRVLRAGGFLTILDFDPPVRHKRAYHHRDGVYSYKARYDEWFTQTGHYHLVAKRSFSHSSAAFSVHPDERLALTVLYKERDPYPSNEPAS